MSVISHLQTRREILEILYDWEQYEPNGTGLEKVSLSKNVKATEKAMAFNINYLEIKNLVKLTPLGRYATPEGPTRLWSHAKITAQGMDVIESVKLLEEEDKKDKPNEGRMGKTLNWLKDNASWIIPILVDVLSKYPQLM